MRLLLDGADLPAEECVGRPLAHVLDVVSALLSEEGRVVLDVQLNGAPPDVEQMQAPFEAAQDWCIEIVSGAPIDLLLQSLRDSASALPELSESLRRLGRSFLQADHSKLQDQLSECITHVRDFFEFLAQVESSAPVDLAHMPVGASTLSLHNSRMAGILEQIVQAFSARDFVRTSDLLQYEAAPALDAYAALVPHMTAAIERAVAAVPHEIKAE